MHPTHSEATQETVAGHRSASPTSSRGAAGGDFGPAGYHPKAVDAFVASVAEKLDDLQVRHLRTLAEVDELRTRLCQPPAAHSVQRAPAVEQASFSNSAADFDQSATGAAHVIRTEIDIAERRAARIVSDAEAFAANVVDVAKRDAACALAAARVQSSKKLDEAQAAAERILKRAHERSTNLSAVATMDRFGVPSGIDVELREATAAVRATAQTPTNPVNQESQTEQVLVESTGTAEPAATYERTFEALWNASISDVDSKVERYFRPSPFKLAK